MLDKIKNIPEKLLSFVKKYQLSDPRTWGLIVFALISAAVTWSGAKAIQVNFDLQKQEVATAELNKVQQLKNQTQSLKNEYYKTDEYKELAARRLFGKAAPGEKVYVVPKDVALKYVSPEVTEPALAKPKNPLKLPKYQQNIQDWLDFFFHHPPAS